MARWERVVVQIARDDRCGEVFRKTAQRVDALGHGNAAAGDDDRKFRTAQQRRGLVEACRTARGTLDAEWLTELDVDLAVEIVARYVDLRGTSLSQRDVECAARELADSVGPADVRLVLSDLLEERELLDFLEAAVTHRGRARLRRNADDGRMRPVGCGDGRDEVSDARTVLRDADAVAVADSRETVRHMAGALLVRHRDEANSCRLENIERIHVGRAHDSEDMGYPTCGHGFDERFTRRHKRHSRFLFSFID